jgi:hypothetical protein
MTKTNEDMLMEMLKAVWGALDSVMLHCEALKTAYGDLLEMVTTIAKDRSISRDTKDNLCIIAERTMKMYEKMSAKKILH